jgi:hypothetical protein
VKVEPPICCGREQSWQTRPSSDDAAAGRRDRDQRRFGWGTWVAIPSALLACIVVASPAPAESCSKSRDYILLNSAGDLPQRPKVYQDLFKNCLDTLQMSNVKDAFVLKAGAIAVIPKIDGVAATANTLAQFCTRFRAGTLRFIARRELSDAANIARVVDMSVSGATSCRRITGSG